VSSANGTLKLDLQPSRKALLVKEMVARSDLREGRRRESRDRRRKGKGGYHVVSLALSHGCVADDTLSAIRFSRLRVRAVGGCSVGRDGAEVVVPHWKELCGDEEPGPEAVLWRSQSQAIERERREKGHLEQEKSDLDGQPEDEGQGSREGEGGSLSEDMVDVVGTCKDVEREEEATGGDAQDVGPVQRLSPSAVCAVQDLWHPEGVQPEDDHHRAKTERERAQRGGMREGEERRKLYLSKKKSTSRMTAKRAA
jgi:hypothetical protein